MTRRYNSRLAHLHLTYTALEICDLYSVCLATVRRWHALGLTPIDRKRPFLYSGVELRAFIERHNPKRSPLMPGECYCTPCRRAVEPAGKLARIVPRTRTSADIVGVCPHCRRGVFRRVRLAELAFRAGNLTVQYEDDEATVSSDGERLEVTVSAEVGS